MLRLGLWLLLRRSRRRSKGQLLKSARGHALRSVYDVSDQMISGGLGGCRAELIFPRAAWNGGLLVVDGRGLGESREAMEQVLRVKSTWTGLEISRSVEREATAVASLCRFFIADETSSSGGRVSVWRNHLHRMLVIMQISANDDARDCVLFCQNFPWGAKNFPEGA